MTVLSFELKCKKCSSLTQSFNAATPITSVVVYGPGHLIEVGSEHLVQIYTALSLGVISSITPKTADYSSWPLLGYQFGKTVPLKPSTPGIAAEVHFLMMNQL